MRSSTPRCLLRVTLSWCWGAFRPKGELDLPAETGRPGAQVQKELRLAELLSQRFTTGSLEQRVAAEEAYARRLAALGEQYQDASLLAMAAESLTHTTSWDYYEVGSEALM